MFEEVCMMKEGEEKYAGTFELGYTPTQAEKTEMKEKMRKRKIDKAYNLNIEIPHIRDSFPEASHIQQPDITKKEVPGTITQNGELGNWFAVLYNNYQYFE